ncbi:hypothetical protein V5O48_002976 [Marasmius crinis-equi]|uniref:Uncharacterized protein n=1 Tax=Marasmius crinis-equi TaxID=585013 RepID=A0ABR3FUY8_9AGAR
MPVVNVKQLFGVYETVFDPSCKLVTSPFFSATVLAVVRFLVALYTTTTLVIIMVSDGVEDGDAGRNFSYFTTLTYIGICSYYWAAFTQSASYVARKTRGGSGYPLQQWPKWLQSLHLILGTSIITFPILVTVVFWVLLANSESLGSPMLIWRNVSVHALNSVFCFFEMLFTHSPRPRWFFLVPMIIILGGYCGLAYVTEATQGFYTYPFLNPDKGPILAGYIVGIALAECIIFSVVWGLMTFKAKYFPVARHVDAGTSRDDTPELDYSMDEHEKVSKDSKDFV